MTKQITNYSELIREKARLRSLLAEQEFLIKEDWRLIKEDLRPAVIVATSMRRLLTRKGGMTAANLTVNLLADGFVKKILLSKTGWLTRWLIPFLIKNYASHLVDQPGRLWWKIKSLFKKSGETHHDTGMDAV
jgi:hypothetical protein